MTTNILRSAKLALALGAIGTTLIAAAPADVITARQANFKAIGKATKAVNEELKKDAPDIAVIRTNAAALSKAAARVSHFFPKGTGPEAGVKTTALPAIWAKPAEFKAATARFVQGTRGLEVAARSGKLDAIRAAFPTMAGNCKACHENFKSRD